MSEITSFSVLESLEIFEGDLVLVHSFVGRVARVFSPERPRAFSEQMVNYLLEKVGPEGTLVFPTFNFDFCSGKAFSMAGTKSQMGALTSYALGRPDAVRTRHPVYSFVVLGKLAPEFSRIENKSAYSDGSVFGEIKRRGGKIMVIDLPYNQSMTFFHHVEEIENVPYRFHKDFTAPYIDERGVEEIRTYSIFVRDLEKGVETAVDPMGDLFEKTGQVKMVKFANGSFIKIINAAELFDFTVAQMRQNPFLLYRINQENK